MSIQSTIFIRPDPPTRPSHSDPLERIPSDLALPRFLHERAVLELQLAEWCAHPQQHAHILRPSVRPCLTVVCRAHCSENLQQTLLDVRRRRNNGQITLSGHTELAEGFFVKTEM